jgi:hypothetical protein
MPICERDEQGENADFSIPESLETDSNVNFHRDSHLHKQLGGVMNIPKMPNSQRRKVSKQKCLSRFECNP